MLPSTRHVFSFGPDFLILKCRKTNCILLSKKLQMHGAVRQPAKSRPWRHEAQERPRNLRFLSGPQWLICNMTCSHKSPVQFRPPRILGTTLVLLNQQPRGFQTDGKTQSGSPSARQAPGWEPEGDEAPGPSLNRKMFMFHPNSLE